MPILESEIELLEVFSRSKVIAITLNHEDMNEHEVEEKVLEYEEKYNLPVSDVLVHGCDKLVEKLFEVFPELTDVKPELWELQD